MDRKLFSAAAALMILFTIPGPAATDAASQGSVSFVTSGGYTTGNYIDGPAWIAVPSGGGTLDAITPAQTTDDSGYVMNGAQLNPSAEEEYGIKKQGFDERQKHIDRVSYDPALTLQLPAAVKPGDVVAKSVAYTDVAWGSSGQRRGIFSEWAACFIVEAGQEPAATDFAPAVCGWNGRTSPVSYSGIDLDAIVATLPSRDNTGQAMPKYDDIMAAIDKFNPIFPMKYGAHTKGGYQTFLTHGFGGGSNYGRETGQVLGRAGRLLCSKYTLDAGDNEVLLTAAQKKQLLLRLIQHGIQWFVPLDGADLDPIGGNGGHYQFMQIQVGLALKYAGVAPLSELADHVPGNPFAQAFQITPGLLENNFIVHRTSDKYKPANYLLREITAADQASQTITVGIPTNYTSLIATRHPDGAFAKVTGRSGSVLTLASWPGFAAGDSVWFDAPYELKAGEYNWNIRGSNDWDTWKEFNPYYSASYQALQKAWTDVLMVMKDLGTWDEGTMHQLYGYCILANLDDTPAAGEDFPTTLGDQGCVDWWNAFWPTIQSERSEAPVVTELYAGPDPDDIDPDAVIKLTFSQPILAGTGTVQLYDLDGGAAWETFDITADAGTGAGSVNIDGQVLEIRPGGTLSGPRSYSVRLAAGVLENEFGDGVAAADAGTLTVATTGVREAVMPARAPGSAVPAGVLWGMDGKPVREERAAPGMYIVNDKGMMRKVVIVR